MATIRYKALALYDLQDDHVDWANSLLSICPINVFEEAERRDMEISIRQALIKTGVSNRAKRARFMLYLYYWQGLTLEEIGDEFDLSRERVRQILDWILAKLQRILER